MRQRGGVYKCRARYGRAGMRDASIGQNTVSRPFAPGLQGQRTVYEINQGDRADKLKEVRSSCDLFPLDDAVVELSLECIKKKES